MERDEIYGPTPAGQAEPERDATGAHLAAIVLGSSVFSGLAAAIGLLASSCAA